jgi:hypothetical protein
LPPPYSSGPVLLGICNRASTLGERYRNQPDMGYILEELGIHCDRQRFKNMIVYIIV